MSAHSPSDVLWKRAARGGFVVLAVLIGSYSAGRMVYGTTSPGILAAVILFPLFIIVATVATVMWYVLFAMAGRRTLRFATEVRE